MLASVASANAPHVGSFLSCFHLPSSSLHLVQADGYIVGRSISILSMVISVALTILFGILVDVAMRKRLRNIVMVESLKSVE